MTIEQREQTFKEQVNRMIAFPYELRVEFFQYWSEPNKSGTKMRFELEKTWDLKRRLTRWQLNNQAKPVYKGTQPVKMEYKEQKVMTPTNEIEALDQLLNAYALHPTTVPFEAFGRWYDYLKKEQLLRPFTRGEVDHLRSVYKDNTKCRCAVVQMTFDRYVNSGFTFKKVFEVREKLTVK